MPESQHVDGNPPTVSIITGIYNSEAYLENFFRMLELQTCQDWEVILVDDGSQDASCQMIEARAKKDPRIRFVRKAPEGIPSRSRAVGLSLAEGKFVAFCDHDDFWSPQKLEFQLEVFKRHSDASIVNTNLIVWTSLVHPSKYFLFEGLAQEIPITYHPPAQLIHRGLQIIFSSFMGTTELVRRAGFQPDLKGVDDSYLFVRLAQLGSTYSVALPLTYFLPHSENHNPRKRLVVEGFYKVYEALKKDKVHHFPNHHLQLHLSPIKVKAKGITDEVQKIQFPNLAKSAEFNSQIDNPTGGNRFKPTTYIDVKVIRKVKLLKIIEPIDNASLAELVHLPNLKVIEYSQGILNKSIIEEIPNFLVTEIELRCSSSNYKMTKMNVPMTETFVANMTMSPKIPVDWNNTSLGISRDARMRDSSDSSVDEGHAKSTFSLTKQVLNWMHYAFVESGPYENIVIPQLREQLHLNIESLGMVVKFSRTSAQPQQPTDLLTTSINIQTVPPMLEVLHPLNFGQVEIASWSKDYSSLKKLPLFSGAIHPAVLKLTVFADLDTDAFLSLAKHFPEVEQIHISSADFVLKCDIQKLFPKLKRFIGEARSYQSNKEVIDLVKIETARWKDVEVNLNYSDEGHFESTSSHTLNEGERFTKGWP